MERVAVIGLGNIAIRHRRNLKFLYPESTLFSMSASGRVPDEDVDNSDVFVSCIQELISKDIQLAIVASPATHHSCHAVPLIESGIPTLIEKPIAANILDASQVLKAEEIYGAPVSVAYCLRYLPSAKKMKSFVERGTIGCLYNVSVEVGQYLPDWRLYKDYRDSVSANARLGGGALLELSHEIDYAQWILGPLSVKYAALRSSDELGLDVEDSVDIVATTEDNAVVNIHLDFLQRRAVRQCRFVGSKGVIIWDLIKNEIQLLSKEGSVFLYQESGWDKNQMYLEMVTDFVRKTKGLESQSVSVLESVEIVTLIEKIKRNYSIN